MLESSNKSSVHFDKGQQKLLIITTAIAFDHLVKGFVILAQKCLLDFHKINLKRDRYFKLTQSTANLLITKRKSCQPNTCPVFVLGEGGDF